MIIESLVMCNTSTNFPVANIFFPHQDDSTGWHCQQGRWIGTGTAPVWINTTPKQNREKKLKISETENRHKIFWEGSKISSKN